MAFVVVYDACVLYPAPLRDLLVRLAASGVVRPRWTETVLDECFRNIAKQRPTGRERAAPIDSSASSRRFLSCVTCGIGWQADAPQPKVASSILAGGASGGWVTWVLETRPCAPREARGRRR
ncbi:MAG: hypothetical protein FJ096_17395 [Deltaproteobacteria bacterium]|nr:hypothetical protein [Deltaproteobacteria bacterium]